MSIDRVARLAQVTTSALRYYESRGLIAEGVRVGGRRHYTPSVLNRLSIIRTLQLIGFSLADIGELLDETRPADAWRTAIAARREQVRQQIRQLNDLAAALDVELDRSP